jgi:hypothetical protein
LSRDAVDIPPSLRKLSAISALKTEVDTYDRLKVGLDPHRTARRPTCAPGLRRPSWHGAFDSSRRADPPDPTAINSRVFLSIIPRVASAIRAVAIQTSETLNGDGTCTSNSSLYSCALTDTPWTLRTNADGTPDNVFINNTPASSPNLGYPAAGVGTEQALFAPSLAHGIMIVGKVNHELVARPGELSLRLMRTSKRQHRHPYFHTMRAATEDHSAQQ